MAFFMDISRGYIKPYYTHRMTLANWHNFKRKCPFYRHATLPGQITIQRVFANRLRRRLCWHLNLHIVIIKQENRNFSIYFTCIINTHSYQNCQYIILPSAVKTRYDVACYCTHHCRKWGRISIRDWTHKRHLIPRPDGRAMGCLSRIFWRKLTAL